MNRRYILACLAVLLFMFGYECLLHRVLLAHFYMELPDLWRNQPEMTWLILYQIFFAFLFGFIFTKGYENRGIAEGARYGWWIGLLLTPLNLMWYAVLPLQPMLIVGWCVGGLIEWTIAGMILAAIYRPLESRRF